MRALMAFSLCLFVFAGVGRAADPTKQDAVKTLNDFLAAIEAKDWKKAASMHLETPDFKAKDAEKNCTNMVARKHIGKKGIEVLAAKGKFGKWTYRKLEEIAKDLKLKPANFYSLEMGERAPSAQFYWDGKKLKILKVSSIGQLE